MRISAQAHVTGTLCSCPLQERKEQKRITQKAPAVVMNIFKRMFGGKKSKPATGKESKEEEAPAAVPVVTQPASVAAA